MNKTKKPIKAAPARKRSEGKINYERRNLRINVTRENIDEAIRSSSSHCMIADALKDTLALRAIRFGKVGVDLQTIRYSDLKQKVRYVYLTPPIAQAALTAFDGGIEIAPFAFILSRDRAVQVIPLRRARRNRAKVLARNIVKHSEGGRISLREVRVEGGSPPPRGVLAFGGNFQGKRREFGMNTLAVGMKNLIRAQQERDEKRDEELALKNENV